MKNIGFFIYGKQVSAAMRLTIAVLLPALLFAWYGNLLSGVILSVGALCAAVTDLPGPVKERRTGMFCCTLLVALIGLIAGLAAGKLYLEYAEIIVCCFFFSMFTIFGVRAAAIGANVLMTMSLILFQHPVGGQIYRNALLLLTGGSWYMILAFLSYLLMPDRLLRQTLAECIGETAKAIALRAKFYDPAVNDDQVFAELGRQQIKVNESQEAVRQLLFGFGGINKEIKKDETLVIIFVSLVDAYEEMTAINNGNNGNFGVPKDPLIINALLELHLLFAKELIRGAFAIQRGKNFQADNHPDFLLRSLQEHATSPSGRLVELNTKDLQKEIIVLNNINQLIHRIQSRHPVKSDEKSLPELEYDRFSNPVVISPRIFLENITLKSISFRYSVRIALVAFAGFLIANKFAQGIHSYWILYTIIFVLKPSFSLSKKRNWQRVAGTLAGSTIAFLLLYFVTGNTMLFIILICLLPLAYSFLQLNYLVFVTFITCCILILFRLEGIGSATLVRERVLDTLIGSAVAFGASYWIFPNWESEAIIGYMKAVLSSNVEYLKVLIAFLVDHANVTEYKVIRRAVYINATNLRLAFDKLTAEPDKRQTDKKVIQRFIMLNYQLSSLVAGLIHPLSKDQEQKGITQASKRALGNALEFLSRAQSAISDLKEDPGTLSTNFCGNNDSAGRKIKTDREVEMYSITKVCLDILKNVADFRP
jgi:uncharacterized membrane protein YccC